MTRDDAFIRQLESYLDEHEGPTPLPETVRAEVRAALPRTKQVGSRGGPMRYLIMTNKLAPMAFAAAAVVLAVAIGAFVLTRPNVGDRPPPAPSPSSSASAAAIASPSIPAEECTDTQTRVAGTSTLEIDWCVARPTGSNELIPFSMEGSPSWLDLDFGDINALWLAPEEGGRIAFVLNSEESVDTVVTDIRAREGYAVSGEAAADVGGAEGVVIDVGLAEGASSGAVEPLVVTSGQNWTLASGTTARVWVVDKDGETLMIIAGEQLADAVATSLATLVWEE
jgi:hypothetical protein